MLSGVQIKQAMAEEEISIEPFDEELIDGMVYEVRLGSKIWIPKPGQVVDLREKTDPEYEETEMEDEGFLLEPGMFVVSETKETITLSRKIAAMLDGRTKLAKLGVAIYQASYFCDPGRSNKLTLEISNVGPFKVKLYSGMKVGSVVFFGTEG